MTEQENIWYCYILQSTVSNRTYNGSTNNLTRRLRQHNGELANGGAKATRIDRPYEYICTLEGFSDHHKTLSCEWSIKHPTGTRKRPNIFNCPSGRIKGLNYLFASEIWEQKFGNENLICKIKEEYRQYLINIPNNVIVEIL